MGYTACFTGMTSCNNSFEIDQRKRLQNVGRIECINHCNDDPYCKFVFLQEENKLSCLKYSNCDTFRIPNSRGTVYSKDNTCPGDNTKTESK